MEMSVFVTKAAVESLIVTEMGYSVTIQGFRRVIVTEMLNIVTKAALERSIVTEMRYSVTNLEEQISPQEDLIRRLRVIA